ncbi:MAG: dephospho-CoA kinase [Bacteroidales bacterium]|nr:dephospho-CoA kinase [Bacteroidales bacterium]
MIKVGLTGNIGSGKSTVSKIFEVLGAPVYHADNNAKAFLCHQEVIDKLRNKFGDCIMSEGIIDRKKLAGIVFNNSKKLGFLNSIIHPLVKQDLIIWMNNMKHHPYIIQEAAILFESGFDKDFEKIILVISTDDLASKRVMMRDGISKHEVELRRSNQWRQDKKIGLADFIIENTEKDMLIPQVLKIHETLLSKK